MAGRLDGKVCVVTGTGGSMGRATALTFAREGASVVGCDVAVEPAEETVELVRTAGGEMVSMQPCRLDDLPGDLRRHGHDIDAHRAVARPGCPHIGIPHSASEHEGDRDRRQGNQQREDPQTSSGRGARRYRVEAREIAALSSSASRRD